MSENKVRFAVISRAGKHDEDLSFSTSAASAAGGVAFFRINP